MMKPATVVRRPSIAKETPKEKTLSRFNSAKATPSDAGQKLSIRSGASSIKTSNASSQYKEARNSQRHPLPSAGEKQGLASRKKMAHSASDFHKKEKQRNLSRLTQNQDISSQLEDDYDCDLVSYNKERAAKSIQRWWKTLTYERMEKQAELAISQARHLNKYKKEKLIKKYVEGRDSVDVGQYWGPKIESQKENFSLFSQQKAEPVQEALSTERQKSSNQKKVAVDLVESSTLKAEPNNGIAILDQQCQQELSKQSQIASIQDHLIEEKQAEEENKLKALNEMIKKKQFQIKQQDEQDFDIFIKKLNEKRSQEQSFGFSSNKRSPTAEAMKEPFKAEHSEIKVQQMGDAEKEPEIRLRVAPSSPQSQAKQTIDAADAKTGLHLRENKQNDQNMNGRYNEFLTFLDNAQQDLNTQSVGISKDSDVLSMSQRSLTQSSKVLNDSGIAYEPKEAYGKIKERLLELEIEKEESQKTLDYLKQIREKEKTELKLGMEKVKEEGSKQAEEVRQMMSERLEKQMSMIEALLEDKKCLADKIEELRTKIKEADKSNEKTRKLMEEKLQIELKKNKEAWIASEKVRKEKWEKERIQEIKQQTVKSIEPELQKIIQSNKEELRKKDEQHQIDLRRKRDEVMEVYEEKLECLRKKLIKEKEEAVDNEREKNLQKLDKVYEKHEQQITEERKRHHDNKYNEVETLELRFKKERDSLEEQLRSAKQTTDRELERERKKFEDRLEEQSRRHQTDYKSLKEQLKIEQEEWKDASIKKQQEEFMERTRKAREDLERDMNRKVEAIINKLGDETHDTQKQLLLKQEKRIREVDEKWRNEIELYKVQITQMKEKLKGENDSRQMLDENMRVLSRRIHDLEIDLIEKKEKLQSLEHEKKELQDKLSRVYREQQAVREEVEDSLRYKIEAKDTEMRGLKNEIQAQEHKFKAEIGSLKTSHRGDLEILQQKVQTAISKKDSTIKGLEEKVVTQEIKIVKLHDMLEKQRKELLK